MKHVESASLQGRIGVLADPHQCLLTSALMVPGFNSMKTWLFRFLVLALLVQLAWARDPESDSSVAPLRIITLDGHEVTPVSQPRRILVINLWATWCIPCRKEMPELEAFYRKYRTQGLELVAVSVDDRSELAAVRQVMAAYSFPAALAVDSDLRGLGRLRYIPATFVIDRDGLLKRNGWQQPATVDFETLEGMVRPLLGSVGK